MQRPLERVPWSRDTSVFWRQQLFWKTHVDIYCPCCDDYLTMLYQDQATAFGAFYCSHCKWMLFLGHSMTDWLWLRHEDWRFAVWFTVPCPLRWLRTLDGEKLMRGTWQEGA